MARDSISSMGPRSVDPVRRLMAGGALQPVVVRDRPFYPEASLPDAGLLSSKVGAPRLPPGRVHRPDFSRRLDEGTRRPLTVVKAGAGWGKTLAVADWAASGALSDRIAWVSLDS